MTLEIRLLGELEVRSAGQIVRLPPSRKTRALLGYLATTGRAHLRQHLCDLFWDRPNDPRAALRWSLSKLRPLLDTDGSTRLITTHDHVGIDPAAVWTDLSAIRSGVARSIESIPTDVLHAYSADFRGDFLEALSLPDHFRYHTWWLAEREAARRLHVRILAELVDRHAADPATALPYAREWSAVEPASEAAHGVVMRMLAGLGRVSEALEQYVICRSILARELAVRPSAELERLRRQLRPGRVEARSDPAAPIPAGAGRLSTTPGSDNAELRSAGASPHALPLFGQREILIAFDTAVVAAAEGTVGMILVEGEPGIGKTRLLGELVRRVEDAGGLVLAARAFEAERIRAYGPWTDALRGAPQDLASPEHLPGLAPLLAARPAAAFDVPATEAGATAERERLFDDVVRLLDEIAGSAALAAVVIDDVQWLDEASSALLHAVVRASAGRRILIACAARPAELYDNPPMLALIRSLQRDSLLRRLPVPPLGPDDTAALARAAVPGIDPAAAVTESAGNPFYATVLARACGVGVPELLRRITVLEERGILVSAPAGRFDFGHDLVRRAAYALLSESGRRSMHLEIARALAVLPDPTGVLAGEIARHAEAGGDLVLAAKACADAAKRSLRVFAHAEAAELVVRGLRHVEALGDWERIPLENELLGVAVFSPEGRRVPGLHDRLTRVAAAVEATAPYAEAQSALYLRSQLVYLQGDTGSAYRLSIEAEQVGRAGDPMGVARAIADHARCLGLLQREMDHAESLAREAEALAASLGRELLEVPVALGLARHYGGEWGDAEHHYRQAVALARREGERWWECFLLTQLVMTAIERGDGDTARDRCRELIPVTRRLGEGSEGPFAAALASLACYDPEEADSVAELDRGVSHLRRLDSKWMVAYIQTLAAERDLQAESTSRAAARAREALRCADAVSRASDAAHARAVLAACSVAAGDPASAAEHLISLERGDRARSPLSARARAAIASAHARLAKAVSTADPTPVSTSPA